ncbi:hypothetical protein FOA52_012955 [Chlamydomonas sp. UWO 241]|nr:hypothetical protein FOA52_012955 [Chlamydomonas sp. UWO 241]
MTGFSRVVREEDKSACRRALESLLLMMTVACLSWPMLDALLRYMHGNALDPERPLLGSMPIPRVEFFRLRAPSMDGVNMRFAGGGGAVGSAPRPHMAPNLRRDNIRARLPPPVPAPSPRVSPTMAFKLA